MQLDLRRSESARRAAWCAGLIAATVTASCKPATSDASPVRALAAGTRSWFPIGPTPLSNGPTYSSATVPASGRATAIGANPADTGEVWLGTATGGVWYTQDAQSTDPTWVPIDGLQFPDNLPGPTGNVSPGAVALSIGAIVPDGCAKGNSCKRVWIGTGENGIRRDTLYGGGLYLLQIPRITAPVRALAPSRLSEIADFRYGSIVRIVQPAHADGTTSDTLYVAVSSGVTSLSSEASVTAPEPTAAGGFGIYVTTDAGAKFTKLPVPGVGGSLPTDIEIDPSDPTGQTLLAGFMARNRYDPTAARGVFRATSGGLKETDWCSVNDNSHTGVQQCSGGSGLPAGALVIPNAPITGQDEVLGYVTLRFSPTVDHRVYALIGLCGQRGDFGCPGSTYRSDDGGLTWTTLANPLLIDTLPFYGRYTHGLAVVPNGSASNESMLVGGVLLGLCSGQDGSCSQVGDTFTTVHPDHHDVVFPDPKNGSVIYNANDGGFSASIDAGTTWTSSNSTLTTAQFSSLAVYDHSAFGGLQDQGMGYFTGTRVWNDRQIGDGGDAVVYSYGTPPHAAWYYSGGQGTPFRSIDDPTVSIEALRPFLPASAGQQANEEGDPANPTPAETAFFPRLAINSANHDIYFATIQVYKSTDTADPHGNSWTTISDVLATPAADIVDGLDAHSAITALAVGDDGTVYAGTYTGEVWVGAGPCADVTTCSWSKVAGPGSSNPSALPNLPVAAFAVEPGKSSSAFVALSGFGTANHVWKTIDTGATWTVASAGLIDSPTNAIRFDTEGTLWAGTDIGIYSFDGSAWTHDFTLPFLPVTAIAPWKDSDGTPRLFAATHGRGTWVLTAPTVTTLAGWSMGGIWDIPVYGYGFLNTTGAPVDCTVSLVQQSGRLCATSGVDVSPNTHGPGGTIQVDTNGQLQTTQSGTWDNKPVVWACNNHHCLGGVSIDSCNADSSGLTDFVSTVIVDCGTAGIGFGRILGAPTLGNPPSSSLGLDPPANAPKALKVAATPANWIFEAVVSASTTADPLLLCRAPVVVPQGAPEADMAVAAAAALNASPDCQASGVTAFADRSNRRTGEDPGKSLPSVTVKSTGLSASELFVTFRSAPGNANGLCFQLAGLGNPILHQTAIMRTVVNTLPGGAAGGSIRLIEGTDIGICQRDIRTTPGMTASQVADAVGRAFDAITAPGPANCLARNDALDIEVDGSSLFTVIAHRLQVCSFDTGVGFVVSPDSLDVPNDAPDCTKPSVTPSTLFPQNHKFVAIGINVTDPNGEPVTLTITKVQQDENPRGKVDAQLVGGKLLLRAERDGRGDGRIYHIQFKASDTEGASCSGEVTVCVAHDQGNAKPACVDGGVLYGSGIP